MSSDNGMFEITIDGHSVTVPKHTTIYDAAASIPDHPIHIPKLCHLENERPVGVCRICMVEVEGKNGLMPAAACVREVEQGMVIHTNPDRVQRVRHTLIELLMSDHPTPCARQEQKGDCELEKMAADAGIRKPRYATRTAWREKDETSQIVVVDTDACILCDRCIRGCVEITKHFVLARHGKGYEAGIAFDDLQKMGKSSCVSCGECMVDCPTGALTNKGVVGAVLEGEILEVPELKKLSFFEHVSGNFLGLNNNAIVRRHFKAGEIICKEGENGRTAFYIEEGSVKVYLTTPMKHVSTQNTSTGFFKRLSSQLRGREEDRREKGESFRADISIDAPVTLPYEKRLAEMHAGDLFGEMTCLNRRPRSATVKALTDCTVLEMLRNVLDIMLRNKAFKAQFDKDYRLRALNNHLRGVDVFQSLGEEFLTELRDSAELLRMEPGTEICKQNDEADAFYLVRLGFVKVSQAYTGGDIVQAYLGPGSYFGEIGLLTPEGKRTATCTAVDHVELVKIGRDMFQRMVEKYPDVRQKLMKVVESRLKEDRERLVRADTTTVEQFVNQGLFQAESLLLLDLERCTRCDACVRACAEAHNGVTRLIREGLRFENYLVATSCRHCRDPFCMMGCPVSAIGRHEGKEVIIENWCIGCGKCAENCPYGNIHMHKTYEGERPVVKATSCDLCLHHETPSCVYACPHDAARREDDPAKFFRDLLSKREGL